MSVGVALLLFWKPLTPSSFFLLRDLSPAAISGSRYCCSIVSCWAAEKSHEQKFLLLLSKVSLSLIGRLSVITSERKYQQPCVNETLRSFILVWQTQLLIKPNACWIAMGVIEGFIPTSRHQDETCCHVRVMTWYPLHNRTAAPFIALARGLSVHGSSPTSFCTRIFVSLCSFQREDE